MTSISSPSSKHARERRQDLRTADALRDRFLHVRQTTERLAASLSDEDCARKARGIHSRCAE